MMSRIEKNNLIRQILATLQKYYGDVFEYLKNTYNIIFKNVTEFIENKKALIESGKEDIVLNRLFAVRKAELERGVCFG